MFASTRVTPEAIRRWLIVWLLSGRRFRDVSCGFRAFSREALLRMNLFGSFTYTQETFLDLIFKGLEIVEGLIFYRDRQLQTEHLQLEEIRAQLKQIALIDRLRQ